MTEIFFTQANMSALWNMNTCRKFIHIKGINRNRFIQRSLRRYLIEVKDKNTPTSFFLHFRNLCVTTLFLVLNDILHQESHKELRTIVSLPFYLLIFFRFIRI